jgi:FixJ family two-component response regulator
MNRDRIALALLDVVMPKMNGTDAYARMFAMDPKLPAIFVTGYSSDLPLLSNNLTKELAVLQKPYTRKDLGCKVREVLDHA